MTESETPQASPETGADPVSDESAQAEPAKSPARPSRRGNATGLVALLLALAALVAAAYPYAIEYFGGSEPDPAEALADRLDGLASRIDRVAAAGDDPAETLRGEIESVRAELDSLRAALEQRGEEAARFDRRLSGLADRLAAARGEREDALGGLGARLSALERSVGERLEGFEIRLEQLGGELDEAGDERRIRLRLIEIDSLLVFAQNRLAFGANVDAARRAWQRAIEMIETLPAARFGGLGDTARAELARIEGYQPTERAPAVARLFEIAARTDDWSVEGRAAGADRPAVAGDAGSWRGRVASALGRLVRVEPIDQGGPSRAERERAGADAAVALRTAGLALARSDLELAGKLVDEAEALIESVFDSADPGVSEALAWLSAFDPAEAPPPVLDETRARVAALLGESS